MNNLFLKLIVKIQDLANREDGQDLVEYALLIALVSAGLIAAGTKLSSGISGAFSQISSTLA